jgi:sugar phosphate isomerase/epimerase
MAARPMMSLPASVPIGVQLYSVGAELQKDVPGTLKRLRAIGYARVESAGFAGLGAKEFRVRLDEAGLACPSAHMPLGDGELGHLFDDAHTVGAHYVVCSGLLPKRPEGQDSTIEDYATMADRLNVIGRQAKTAGLQFAYHNHNFEFKKLEGGQVGYDVLLAKTDPEAVAFELDCGWAVTAGVSPADYFARNPGRFRMLHIKDFVEKPLPIYSLAKDKRPQGTELGRGHIDYKPILAAAAKAGIKDYHVEQEPPFVEMTAMEAVEVDYRYLRAI